jgi:cytochrome c peroxidase
MNRSLIPLTVLLFPAALAACSGGPGEAEDGALGTSAQALLGPVVDGRYAFDHALPGTNGRSCATCHVASEHRALVPANVEARFESDPFDPLFNRLDADDPTAPIPTYEHLRKRALVRVTFEIAPNLDVIDEDGNVITNAERTVSLWRGVPTVENTSLTAPYQYDGRAATLEDQALAALQDHSAIDHDPAPVVLDDIAAFEQTVYSSPGVAAVAAALADGTAPPDPDPPLVPGSDAAAGQVLFQNICAACHGGPQGNQITIRAAAHELFFQLNADGTVQGTESDGFFIPTEATSHFTDDFLPLGIALGAYLRQIPPDQGGIFDPTAVPLPHLRIRFYTDGTRTQQLMDLPPTPPLIGFNLVPQSFSVDPGRALITGDPYDFEAFDIPQLRGIANTAPYFHDASSATLEDVLDIYSQLILPFLPALNLPPVVPPAGPGLPPESLTATQKAQIIAYLQKI